MLLVIKIILGIAILADVGLLALVVRKRESLLQKAFALYVVSMTAWGLAIFSNLWLESTVVAYCVFALAAELCLVQFWIVKIFLSEKLVRPWLHWSSLVGAALIGVSFVPGALFTAISFHPEGYVSLVAGYASGVYSLAMLCFAWTPPLLLARAYHKAAPSEKRGLIRILALGFFIFAFVSVLTNSVLPVFFGIYFFNALGPVFSLFFAAAMFHVIWRYEFLDIRIVIQRGIIFSALLVLVVGAYLGMLTVFGIIIGEASRITGPVSAGVVMVLGIFTVPSLRRRLIRWTDHIFFQDHYDYSAALGELSDILNTNTEPYPLAQQSASALNRILRVRNVAFELRHVVVVTVGEQAGSDFACTLPLKTGGEEVGRLLVGVKKSGDPFTVEDMSLLRTFASQAAVAIRKAELYHEVQEHSRNLEEKVRARTRHIQQLQLEERQMIDDVSHAFQTPLTVLKGAVGLLLKDGNALDHADVLAMERTVDDLSRRVADLLRLARLGTEDAHTTQSAIDMSTLAEEVAEYSEIVCRERGITLCRDIEPGMRILGDEKRLEELLTNLLSNAVKYTEGCSVQRINMIMRREGNDVLIRITDTGIGIAAHDLQKIFGRFYRAQEDGARVGTGLGLAICKKIVEQHGGVISAESEGVNKGTTVIVRLPSVS